MPNIRVSDDVYDRLKAFSDREMRSISNATEYLLSLQLGNDGGIGVPIKTPPSQENTSSKSLGDILADIRDLEGRRDEELRYCQDDEYRKQITSRYNSFIQPLWDEYNLLKG